MSGHYGWGHGSTATSSAWAPGTLAGGSPQPPLEQAFRSPAYDPFTQPAPPLRLTKTPSNGTLIGGFAAGFFGGLVGVALVRYFAKGDDTWNGAWFGFISAFVIGLLLRAIAPAVMR